MRALRRRRRITAVLFVFALHSGAVGAVGEVDGAARVCVDGPQEAVALAEEARGAAGVAAADVLPNPSLVAQQQGALNGAKGQETIVGVNVPLGLGGRWFLKQDAARARRDAALADAHATRFDSALAFRAAFIEAAVARARVDVLTEQQAALDALSVTIDKLAQAGETASYDLARQQTQARLHRRLLGSARAELARAARTLQLWTGDEAVADVDLADLAGGAAVVAADNDESRRARLHSLEAQARASEADAAAAGRRWIPDPELFAGYRTVSADAGEREHGFAVWLTVPLTFFDHGQGEAAAADAERAVARAQVRSLRGRYDAERAAAVSQLVALEASRAEVERAATEALVLQEKATRLYAAGESSITELIDAFRTAEEARLARVALADEIADARLAIMRASGSFFDKLLDDKCAKISGEQR